MSITRIKFCGITRDQDAELAVSLDAWAVGINLWPESKRFVSLQRATELGAILKRRAEVVGVFVNPTLEEVARAAQEADLTIVQLHGQEGPVFCGEVARRTGCRVIKAARVQGRAEIQALAAYHTDFHLLDSYVAGVPGGTGESFAWDLAASHKNVPLILSGGLTPANVAEAIGIVRPYAVDVASGIESAPGYKDSEKMRAFAEAVRATDPQVQEPELEPTTDTHEHAA
jgi:phosphoribosylanthranilate isomerase